MRAWQLQFACALAALLLAGGVAAPVLAQRGLGQSRGKRPGVENGREAGKHPEAEKKANLGMRVPPKWMEQLREMPPEEQERFLKNNERFQKLPPERQAQIRKRLQQWNSLTPEQRAAVRKREEIWRQMSPEQQRYVREELLPRWQKLAPERRYAILQRLRPLRRMNEAQRAAKLNDPAFLGDLNPDERLMLRALTKLRAGAAPELPQESL